MSSSVDSVAEIIPFSRLVRERSSASHSTSESAGFMHDLLKGELGRSEYTQLVAQHWAIYDALEGAQALVAGDETVAPFLSPALTRLPALEADLQFLLGDDWREHLVLMPATVEYAARIREVAATWPAGYIAHHYTRYLGDLSGGIHIGKVVARRFGFETNGIGFYLFDQIADPAAFKNEYRAQLDAAPWSDDEKSRIVDEVVLSYDYNTRIFEQLSERLAAA